MNAALLPSLRWKTHEIALETQNLLFSAFTVAASLKNSYAALLPSLRWKTHEIALETQNLHLSAFTVAVSLKNSYTALLPSQRTTLDHN